MKKVEWERVGQQICACMFCKQNSFNDSALDIKFHLGFKYFHIR
jgi:hypothetical protein